MYVITVELDTDSASTAQAAVDAIEAVVGLLPENSLVKVG